MARSASVLAAMACVLGPRSVLGLIPLLDGGKAMPSERSARVVFRVASARAPSCARVSTALSTRGLVAIAKPRRDVRRLLRRSDRQAGRRGRVPGNVGRQEEHGGERTARLDLRSGGMPAARGARPPRSVLTSRLSLSPCQIQFPPVPNVEEAKFGTPLK